MIRDQVIPAILGCLLIIATVGLLTTPYYYLAPLPSIGIFLTMALWKKPLYGFLLIVLLIPFDQYRSLSSQLKWFTISKVLGAVLVCILLAQWLITKRQLPIRSHLWPYLVILVIISVMSSLFSDFTTTAANDLRQLITSISFFALTICLVKADDILTSITKVLVTGITCSATLSLYGYITKDPLFAVVAGDDAITRATGGANDPNLFCLSLLVAIPLLVHYILESRSTSGRITAICFTLINTFALMATFSRGGALNFIIVVIMLAVAHRKKLRPRSAGLLISAFFAVVLLVFVITPRAYWERQSSLVTTQDESINRRIDYLKVGWLQFIENPIIGHGPGTFKDVWEQSVYEGVVSKGASKGYKRRAHNTYLEILIGQGILGLATYLLLITTAMICLLKAQGNYVAKNMRTKASLTEAYRISFTAILVYFLIISAPTQKFFWVVLAFSQILLKDSTLEDSST